MEQTALITQIQQKEVKQNNKGSKPQPVLSGPNEEEDNPLKKSPYHQYFTRLDPHNSLLGITKKYNSSLQGKLQQQIQEGKIAVSGKKKQFPIAEKSSPSQQEMLENERKIFLEKKAEVLQKLNEVYKEQRDMVVKNNSLVRSRKRSQSHFEGYDSSNWIQEIRKAIKENRKFKSFIKKKQKQVLEKEEQVKKAKLKQYEDFLSQMKEVHSKEAQKKKEQYSKTKEEMHQVQKKCEQFISKLKPQKYHHEVIDQVKNQELRKVESQRELKLSQYRRKRQVDDWQLIREHQYRYFEYLEERKESWVDQFNSFREEHRSRLRNYRGLYADRAKDQVQFMRRRATIEGEKGLKMLEKIKDYDEYVHSNFKPKLQKSTFNSEGTKKGETHISLDRSQTRLKGLQYLNKVKETVKSFRVLPKSQEIKEREGKTVSLPKIQSQTTYKNYLKDLPIKKKQGSNIDQFQEALSEKKGDWAESAINLISKMQASYYKGGSKPLISSAFNKIELLNAMY